MPSFSRSPHLTQAWSALDLGDCQAVLAVTPPEDDADAWHLQAVALERLGRLEEARRLCDVALRHVPEHVGARLTRGMIHSRLGARMTALEDLRRARRLSDGGLVASHLVRSVGGGDFSAPLHGEVVELFERYAPGFDRHLVEDLEYRGHEVVPALAREAAGDSLPLGVVWDLGCGSGLCGPALRPLAERLVGVDIAPAMVALAAERGCYDATFAGDLVYALALAADRSASLLLSADVLGYLGPLEAVVEQAARVLHAGGWLVFSVEAAEGCGRFVLQPSRRCAYDSAYLLALADDAGFECAHHHRKPLRRESGQAVGAHVMAWRLTRG